jgi:competence protein ComGC
MTESMTPLPGASSETKTSTLAVWSLVLGILGLVLTVVCLTIFLAIPAVICGHKALSRIKGSAGALAGHGMAIAGLVTGYVGIGVSILLIPLLVAIAIPNFIKARETSMTNACINNLRQIDAAKNQWALDHQKQATDTPTESDLLPYLRNHQWPQCPAGGTYIIGQDSVPPSCSVTNHVLPAN